MKATKITKTRKKIIKKSNFTMVKKEVKKVVGISF